MQETVQNTTPQKTSSNSHQYVYDWVESYFDAAAHDSLCLIESASIFSEVKHFDLSQLRLFARAFYYFVEFFPKYIGGLIFHCPDDRVRYALIDNLVDESGGIDCLERMEISQAHPNIYILFMKELGVADFDNHIASKKYVIDMIASLRSLSTHKHFLVSLGGLSPGLENIFSTWISTLHEQIKQTRLVSDESLLYFSLHAEVDVEHGEKLKQCVLPLLTSRRDAELLREGSITMARIFSDFFMALSEDIACMSKESSDLPSHKER